MIRRLLLALALMSAPALAQQGNTLTLTGAGAPTGSCSFMFRYVDSTNNDLYFCSNSVWVKANGGGGGGTPGAPDTSVQFRTNATTFGGSANALENSSGQVQFGVDGVSTPGAFQLYPGGGIQAFTTSANILQTTTAITPANMGFAPFVSQQVLNPSGTDDNNYYSAGAFYNVIPVGNAQNIGTQDGIFSEVKHIGSGALGGGTAADNGQTAIDGEAFIFGSGTIGVHGSRGVYGLAGYLGSGASTTGSMTGGEFRFEIGNGSSGSLAAAFGLASDQPANFAGTGTTTVTAYTSLDLGCTTTAFITTFTCINITGTAPNNFGTGISNFGGQVALTAAGGGSAAAPLLYAGTDVHTGWYHPASNTWAFSANSALGLEINYANGLFLHDGNNINFDSGTTSLAKDTSISRKAAGVIAIGAGASTNDSTGKLKAAGYIAEGTKFTTDNGCTDAATVGGATAGKFTVGNAVTSCTEVITMGNTATAPNGWSCTTIDLTTLADVTNPHQTATSTTTATIVTGTIVASDVIQFSCIGY